jgi:murein DD-endopeptidase MepM/ murein hydrolase activator NlpD
LDISAKRVDSCSKLCYIGDTDLCTPKRAVFIRASDFLKNSPKNLILGLKSLKERHRSFSGLLGMTVLILGFVYGVNAFNLEKTLSLGRTGVFGGPADSNTVLAQESLALTVPATPVFSPTLSFKNNAVLGFSASVALSTSTSSGALSQSFNNAVFSYTVQENDTLGSLAQKFSVDVNTIVWANSLTSTELVPGDHLVILPVSGVLHEVAQADSLESIAKTYGVVQERIALVNSLLQNETVMPGEKLVIPGGTQKQKLSFTSTSGQNLSGFRMPTTGWNWGKLHANNAVDIANSCGTPVYASASGFVKDARDDGTKSPTSNSGYGSFVLINHKNNLETIYAHLSAVFVSAGAFVNQGDLIGAIGNTGSVDGYTGCHLHFGVYGAPNPFAS